MAEPARLASLRLRVRAGSIPLSVSLSPVDCRTYDLASPYLVRCSRLAYLPSLLARLRDFFAPSLVDPALPAHSAWLSYDGVPLKWHLPLGLLHDMLASPAAEASLPWPLVLHFSDWPTGHLVPLDAAGRVQEDNFINAVKEADALRTGTARAIMSLSRADSTALWESARRLDFDGFDSVARKFLVPVHGTPQRNLPLKFYLPKASAVVGSETTTNAVWRVVQGLVAPRLASGESQTLGTALHALLPTLFPSRRSTIYAEAVLHGAVVPLSAPLDVLLESGAFFDGFLHVVIRLIHSSLP